MFMFFLKFCLKMYDAHFVIFNGYLNKHDNIIVLIKVYIQTQLGKMRKIIIL